MLVIIKCNDYFSKTFDDKEIKQIEEALEDNNDNLDIVFVAELPRNEGKKLETIGWISPIKEHSFGIFSTKECNGEPKYSSPIIGLLNCLVPMGDDRRHGCSEYKSKLVLAGMISLLFNNNSLSINSNINKDENPEFCNFLDLCYEWIVNQWINSKK